MSKATTTSNKKQPKKPALGRGLGSLLGAPAEPENRSANVELEVKEESSAKPVTEKKAEAAKAVEKIEFKQESDSSIKAGFVEKPENAAKTDKTEAKTAQPNVPETQRIWQIPVEKIKPQKDQPRKEFEAESLKELSQSIKEKGVLQPIVVRRNSEKQFEIIAGERRWRAAQMAGLDRLPVILKLTDEQNARELALIENIQREDLNPVEEAEAYEALITKYKLTQQDLADRLGKDRVSVANSLRLLKLHPELRRYLKTGELSQGQAKVLLSVTDSSLQKKLGMETLKKSLTVRATEKLVAKMKNSEASEIDSDDENEFQVSERLAKGLAQELQRTLKTKVSINYKAGKGQLKIQFHSDVELNQIVDRLRK